MIKTAINNFLIWLNTPREIDIPVFGESPDSRLYDDLYKQKELLERRKQRLLNMAAQEITKQVFDKTGLLITDLQAQLLAINDYNDAKTKGYITELNELIKPKENF